MKKQPILILTIAFTLGIFFQDSMVLLDKTIFMVLFFAFLLQFLFLLKTRWVRRGKAILLGFFFFAIGVFAHSIHQKKRQIHFDKNQIYQVDFQLKKVLKSTEKYRKYEVEISTEKGQKTRLLLHIPKENPRLDFTYLYQSKLKIREIPPPLNDYGFNYQKYLERRGVFYQSYLYQPIRMMYKQYSVLSFIRQKREGLLWKIDLSLLSPSSKMLIKSMVLADKTEMEDGLYADFKRSGMVHILAISGMHVAVIFGFFYWLFSFIFKRKKWVIAASLVFIWVFAVFIGLGNSVFRACLMLTIYFTFDFFQRKRDFLHTWSLAMLVILIFNTQQLFDVGFQLSFSAVFGIFWLYKPIFNLFPNVKRRWQRFIFEVIAVTFSAQLSVLPLVLYYFHAVSLVGIFANVFLIPLMQMVIIASFLMLIFIAFSSFLEPVMMVYDFAIQHLLEIIHFFSQFEWAYLEYIAFHPLEVFFTFLIIFVLRFLLKDFSYRNLVRLGYTILVFMVTRFGLNMYYQNVEEVKVHKTYTESVISVKNGEDVTFYIKTDNNHKMVERYIFQSYLMKMRTKDYKVKKVSSDCKSIVFKGKKYSF